MNNCGKTVLALFLMLMMAAVICGCDSDSDTTEADFGQKDGIHTGSGNEYRAEVNDEGAYIQYLDATLDIENGEFYEDDFEEETYLVLHMTYRNDSSTYRSEGDEDTDFYKDSLIKSFVLQAVQDGDVIEHRSEAEAESIEESNCWELIDSGQSLRCEMYFPVEPDEPVTLQVLNPDGEDTVMAEVTYTP